MEGWKGRIEDSALNGRGKCPGWRLLKRGKEHIGIKDQFCIVFLYLHLRMK